MNKAAVDRAIRFGLAVGAKVAPLSIFARKNYFYPDLPKGYQISQFEIPVVQGGQITADVGGQLSLQSLQDSSRYKESSQTAGFSVTVGPNPSASANVGATKIRSDYQAVAEQTALRAGDGGFQLKVKDGVSLAGAQITSTDKAVQAGVNQLQAGGPVSTSDLLNQAAYDARSVGVSLGQGKDTG